MSNGKQVSFGVCPEKLVELVFSSQESSADYILKIILKDRYYSLNYNTPDIQSVKIGLDKTDTESSKLLIQYANAESKIFMGTNFYSKIKNYTANDFIPIPL